MFRICVMSIIETKTNLDDDTKKSIRYLEHSWPTDLCPRHAHKEYELHLIVQAGGRAFVGDYIGEFKQGNLYLIGPHLPHSWTTDTEFDDPTGIRDMVVQFSHERALSEQNSEGEQSLILVQLRLQFAAILPRQVIGCS
jgi:hypothetical protein